MADADPVAESIMIMESTPSTTDPSPTNPSPMDHDEKQATKSGCDGEKKVENVEEPEEEGIVTESMKEEEAKLHEETVKEEEERKKQTELELQRMDEDMKEQRYKRLQFLLTKSNMYTHYLLRRMHKQKEIEETKRKDKEARKARKEKERAAMSNGDDEQQTESKAENSTEDNKDTAAENTDTNKDTEEKKDIEEKKDTKATKDTDATRDTALSTLDTAAPEPLPHTLRQSPRGSPAVSGRITRRAGEKASPAQTTGKPKRGQKRKAGEENYKISDMFAEALDRNKRRKKEKEEEATNSQEEKSDDGKENDADKANVEAKESKSTKKETTVEEDQYGRYINGELVHDAQPILFTGGVLREYQIEGFRWLKVLYENGVNGILADEMGLGKTIQCIAVIANLVWSGLVGPYLVVAPLSTVTNWVAEFKKFAPKVPVILYHGTQDSRLALRKKMMKLTNVRPGVDVHPVVITSYEIAMNDRKYIANLPWKYIIVDEGHRIKNFQCKLIKELKMYQSTHRLLLTGTPLQNNLQELWSLLNFLLPEIFDDLGSFESWFDISFLETASSNEAIVVEEQRNSILTMLHQILSPFMLRRVKSDVELNIPPKREVLVYAPLSSAQAKQYRTIVDKTIRRLIEGDEEAEIASFEVDKHGRSKRQRRSRYSKETLTSIMDLKEKEKVDDDDDIETWFKSAASPEDWNNNGKGQQVEPKSHELKIQLRNIMFMLRKCVNHPYLIEYPLTEAGEYKIDEQIVTASGKIMLLDRMLGKLKKGGHKVLIFSQMTQMMNILQDYCFFRKYKYCRLDGSMKIEDRTDQIADFNKDPDMFVFLLSTRAGGLGINLTAADTCIIFDSDWNPQCDMQAQDRCHRIGQTKPVMVYRLVTANTVDEKIVERAAAKRKLEKMVITRGKFKSGGCWNDEDASNVPNEEEDLRAAKNGIKVMSAMSPQELLEMLKSQDFDEKHESVKDDGDKVINDTDLGRLLDRSDLWAQMRKKAGKLAEDKKKKDDNEKAAKESSSAAAKKYEDVAGVFALMNVDMGSVMMPKVKDESAK